MPAPHVHPYNWPVDVGEVEIVIDQQPGATPPDDLIAALDGEAPGEVLGRLRAAPESAVELADFARLQGGLQRALHRFDCPNPHDLGEYVLQLLAPVRQTMLAAHLPGCPRCADEVAQFRSFLTAVAVPMPAGPVAQVRHLVASLFTPAPGAAYALRGDKSGRSLVYQAGDLQLTLDAGSVVRRGRSSLTGLVLHERDAAAPIDGGRVTLTAPDGSTLSTTIDDLGNFAFDSLAMGTYQLEVQLGDDLIAINDLQIGR
jgi:hypothetical protein